MILIPLLIIIAPCLWGVSERGGGERREDEVCKEEEIMLWSFG